MADIVPNQTIYLSNINEKIKKEELRKSLYILMSQFGPILDIVAMKSQRMRGQAFVCFKEISSATNALRKLQGFPFYDKLLRVEYSKNKSDIVTKIEGTFNPEEKLERKANKKNEKKRKAEQDPADMPPAKRQEIAAPIVAENNPPNTILYVQNLLEGATDKDLQPLFSRFPGFKGITLVSTKQVAFVEFDSIANSQMALIGIQGFQVSADRRLVVSFAK